MNKLLLAAGAVTAVLLFAGPSTAQAAPKGFNVDVTIQLAGHNRHVRPFYRHHRPVVRRILAPRQIVRLMQRQGYRNCRGWQVHRGVYSLRCLRHGRVFAVRVNGRTGHVIAQRRIG